MRRLAPTHTLTVTQDTYDTAGATPVHTGETTTVDAEPVRLLERNGRAYVVETGEYAAVGPAVRGPVSLLDTVAEGDTASLDPLRDTDPTLDSLTVEAVEAVRGARSSALAGAELRFEVQ